MGKLRTSFSIGLGVFLFVSSMVLAKTPSKGAPKTTPAKPSKTAESAATKPAAAPLDPKEQVKVDALAQYAKFLECYKSGSLTEVPGELKKVNLVRRHLPWKLQSSLITIPKTVKAYRPPWWPNMRSSSNVTFKATLWGRPLTANFVPSDTLGVMQAVAVKNGKLVTVVSWRPSMIDNPKPAKGYLAERHKLKKAAIGEAIGWHELGHNYISYFLPLKHVFILYENHSKLYYHLQEFYADMTSLYHSSPGGRLALMFMRLDGLARYDETEEHDRAAYAVGSLILSNVMLYPKKWPSFHFPPTVPTSEVELNTLRYMYENIDTKWTLAEDTALRTLIK
ncbi:MAG: hypothetical protein HN350_03650 [Phycisphaerales bacterium]|nr:hypothetical protein [Phycisphaerales bacterium]